MRQNFKWKMLKNYSRGSQCYTVPKFFFEYDQILLLALTYYLDY